MEKTLMIALLVYMIITVAGIVRQTSMMEIAVFCGVLIYFMLKLIGGV